MDQLMLQSKKGGLHTGVLVGAIEAIILVVVLFKVYATMVPTAQSAGNELNATGVPFGNFFAGNGLVFILIMVALVLTVVGAFLPKGIGRK